MQGKEKVAKVIPNAILITTESEKYFLTSFASRDKAYVILFRLWQNALMEKPMNQAELWQSVNILREHLWSCAFGGFVVFDRLKGATGLAKAEKWGKLHLSRF